MHPNGDTPAIGLPDSSRRMGDNILTPRAPRSWKPTTSLSVYYYTLLYPRIFWRPTWDPRFVSYGRMALSWWKFCVEIASQHGVRSLDSALLLQIFGTVLQTRPGTGWAWNFPITPRKRKRRSISGPFKATKISEFHGCFTSKTGFYGRFINEHSHMRFMV